MARKEGSKDDGRGGTKKQRRGDRVSDEAARTSVSSVLEIVAVDRTWKPSPRGRTAYLYAELRRTLCLFY